jgi:hypothetical protein
MAVSHDLEMTVLLFQDHSTRCELILDILSKLCLFLQENRAQKFSFHLTYSWTADAHSLLRLYWLEIKLDQ